MGIISGSPGKRIFILRISHYRQSLHGIPSRMGSKFYGQPLFGSRFAILVKQVFQRESMRTFPIHVQRNGFRHPLFVCQNGDVTLFSITEGISIRYHPACHYRIFVTHFKSKVHMPGFSSLHIKLLFL